MYDIYTRVGHEINRASLCWKGKVSGLRLRSVTLGAPVSGICRAGGPIIICASFPVGET